METGALSRGLAVIDVLVSSPDGTPLHSIAQRIDLPKNTVHRILTNLMREGYVRQDPGSGHYSLTLRIVSMALRHLGDRPLVALARPVLDQLAQESGELARLGLVDGDQIIWVAKVQGARSGLRFDPPLGSPIRNPVTSASGLAWLSQLPEEHAVELILKHGLPNPEEFGPTAPVTIVAALERVHQTRTNGYAVVHDSYESGTSAVAVPIVDTVRTVVGVLSIAGPSVRMTDERVAELLPPMRAAAAGLGGYSLGGGGDRV